MLTGHGPAHQRERESVNHVLQINHKGLGSQTTYAELKRGHEDNIYVDIMIYSFSVTYSVTVQCTWHTLLGEKKTLIHEILLFPDKVRR